MAAGSLALLAGMVVLLGWALDRPGWTDWFGSGISMLPNTAVGAAAAGLALILTTIGLVRAGAVVGGLVALLGAASVFEHATGVDLGVDGLLLWREWGQTGTVSPGRMGPPASLALTALGTGIAMVSMGEWGRRAGAVAGAVVVAVCALPITGYLYGASLLYSVSRLTAISMVTALFLLVLGIGLLSLAGALIPMRVRGRQSAAGVLVSRLVPVIVLVPLALGWVRLAGERAGVYDSAFGAALRAMVDIVLLALILGWAVRMVRSKEQALRERDVRFKRMLDALPGAVYTTDAQGLVTYLNPAAEALSGRALRIGVDRWCASWRLLRPDGTPLGAHECPMEEALRGRDVRGMELIAERPDGSRIWLEPHPSAIRDESGRIVGGINMVVDVSQRKQVDLGLARLAAIVESSDDAIVSKNLDGVITTWNRGAERMFGYPAAEAVGRSITLIIPPDRESEEDEVLRRIRSGQSIDHFETERRTKDGRTIHVSLSVSPLRDRSGRVVGASKVARDITERKAAEAALADHQRLLEERVQDRTSQLKTAHERLRLADRMAAVGTLAAGLAHDMKNLLMPLGVHIRAVRSGPGLPPTAEKDLDAIAGLLDHLRAMAQNLSLFARDPNQEGVEGRTALDPWLGQVRGFIEASVGPGVPITWSIRPGLPEIGIAPHRLTQAVLNLVHNARDAILDARRAGTAPAGGGRITVEAEPAGDRVRIRVRDDGCGMCEDVRQRCVDPFFTTKDRTGAAQGSGGTGMGLALALAVTERLGGTLEIESQEGKGTTITLNLPVAGVDSARAAPPAARACVMIEDRRMRSIIGQVLSSLRFEVSSPDEAPDGPLDADVWIVDAARFTADRAREALARPVPRRIIAIDDSADGAAGGLRQAGVHVCPRSAVLSSLRAVLAAETPGARAERTP